MTLRLCQSVPTLEPIGFMDWHALLRREGLMLIFQTWNRLDILKEYGLWYDDASYYITPEAKERYNP